MPPSPRTARRMELDLLVPSHCPDNEDGQPAWFSPEHNEWIEGLYGWTPGTVLTIYQGDRLLTQNAQNIITRDLIMIERSPSQRSSFLDLPAPNEPPLNAWNQTAWFSADHNRWLDHFPRRRPTSERALAGESRSSIDRSRCILRAFQNDPVLTNRAQELILQQMRLTGSPAPEYSLQDEASRATLHAQDPPPAYKPGQPYTIDEYNNLPFELLHIGVRNRTFDEVVNMTDLEILGLPQGVRQSALALRNFADRRLIQRAPPFEVPYALPDRLHDGDIRVQAALTATREEIGELDYRLQARALAIRRLYGTDDMARMDREWALHRQMVLEHSFDRSWERERDAIRARRQPTRAFIRSPPPRASQVDEPINTLDELMGPLLDTPGNLVGEDLGGQHTQISNVLLGGIPLSNSVPRRDVSSQRPRGAAVPAAAMRPRVGDRRAPIPVVTPPALRRQGAFRYPRGSGVMRPRLQPQQPSDRRTSPPRPSPGPSRMSQPTASRGSPSVTHPSGPSMFRRASPFSGIAPPSTRTGTSGVRPPPEMTNRPSTSRGRGQAPNPLPAWSTPGSYTTAGGRNRFAPPDTQSQNDWEDADERDERQNDQ